MFDKEKRRIKDIEDAIKYIDRAGREYSDINRQLKNLSNNIEKCIKGNSANNSESEISARISSLNGDKSDMEHIESSLKNDLEYFKQDLKDSEKEYKERQEALNNGGCGCGCDCCD